MEKEKEKKTGKISHDSITKCTDLYFISLISSVISAFFSAQLKSWGFFALVV